MDTSSHSVGKPLHDVSMPVTTCQPSCENDVVSPELPSASTPRTIEPSRPKVVTLRISGLFHRTVAVLGDVVKRRPGVRFRHQLVNVVDVARGECSRIESHWENVLFVVSPVSTLLHETLREFPPQCSFQYIDHPIVNPEIRRVRSHALPEFLFTFVQRCFDNNVLAVRHLWFLSFGIENAARPRPSRALARSIFASGLHHSSDRIEARDERFVFPDDGGPRAEKPICMYKRPERVQTNIRLECAQRIGDRACRRGSRGPSGRQGPNDEPDQSHRTRGTGPLRLLHNTRRRRDSLPSNAGGDLIGAGPDERTAPGDHLVQHDAQRPDVICFGGRLPRSTLRATHTAGCLLLADQERSSIGTDRNRAAWRSRPTRSRCCSA